MVLNQVGRILEELEHTTGLSLSIWWFSGQDRVLSQRHLPQGNIQERKKLLDVSGPKL